MKIISMDVNYTSMGQQCLFATFSGNGIGTADSKKNKVGLLNWQFDWVVVCPNGYIKA